MKLHHFPLLQLSVLLLLLYKKRAVWSSAVGFFWVFFEHSGHLGHFFEFNTKFLLA